MKPRSSDWLMRLLLLVPGVIHLVPLAGVTGVAVLTRVYGLDFSDPSLEIMMRHRAVLFGLLGLLLVVAAFRPAHRGVALLLGLASTISFLVLGWQVGGYNPAIGRILAFDGVALACLSVAAGLHWGRYQPPRSRR